MSPKKGQKLTDNPKETMVRVRVDDDTLAKLDYLATEKNSDRSKIIRNGIDIQYESVRKK